MPRPRKFRNIQPFNLSSYSFNPESIDNGEKIDGLQKIFINLEELEALRLRHYKKIKQVPASEEMGISQTTFSRIITSAYEKITKALIEGKAINIQDHSFIGSNSPVGRGFHGQGRGMGQSGRQSLRKCMGSDGVSVSNAFQGFGCLNCGFEWEYDSKICPECKSDNIYRLIKKKSS